MRSAAFVLVGLFVAAAGVQGQQPAAKGATVDAAIKQIADAYEKASRAGDAKAIAALYTEDAVEMPPDEPPVKGRAAIEAYYQKQFSGEVKPQGLTLNHIEARAMGDAGYDVGTYQQTLTPPGGKSPMKVTGKFTVILKREGGSWKVAYAIYNSDQPMKMPM